MCAIFYCVKGLDCLTATGQNTQGRCFLQSVIKNEQYLCQRWNFISFLFRPNEILVMLHPYTAENEGGKYVCMQLVIKLDKKVNQLIL